MSRICEDIPIPGEDSPNPPDTNLWKGLPEPRIWKSVDAELRSGLIKPPSQILDGLLYRRGKMLLSAPSKGRKTWMMLHMAACISCGRPWLGFNTARCPVLFLDLELLEHETPQRLKSIADKEQIWDLENLHIQQLRGHRPNIERMKPGIIEYCRTHNIALLVIDPWYKLSGGADEIGTEAVADLLAELEAIAREADCAIAISHHFTKGDSSMKNVIDLASGSGVFGRDPDLICGLREVKNSTDEEPKIKMEFVVRSFKPVLPIGLRWNYPVWEKDDTLDLDLKSALGPGRPKEYSVDDIIEVLGNKTLSVTDWGDLCGAELGVSIRVFKGLKAKATEAGLIETEREGFRVLCRKVCAKNASVISAQRIPHR